MKKNMIILVGPSGVGKSSLLDQAVKDFPDQLKDTVTFTTRPMREGESEGSPYHFVSHKRFSELLKENYFVEWAQVHDNLYGTPFEQIKSYWAEGKTIIMDVDVQGADTFKKHYPDAMTLFILPPSFNSLRQRLLRRDGPTPKSLELRMQNAKIEMARAEEFDHQIVNDNFEDSYTKVKKIIEEIIKES